MQAERAARTQYAVNQYAVKFSSSIELNYASASIQMPAEITRSKLAQNLGILGVRRVA